MCRKILHSGRSRRPFPWQASRHQVVRHRVVLHPVVLHGVVFIWAGLLCGVPLTAQTTADDLYQSVIRLQFLLGDGPEADAVRDRLNLRALETEAARGFNANLNLLVDAQRRIQSLGKTDEPYDAVSQALHDHIQALEQTDAADLLGTVGEFSSDLQPPSLESVDDQRQRVIELLKKLDRYNRNNLSYFGRHYLNKRLQINSLITKLSQLQLQQPDDDAQLRQFLADLNQFRTTVDEARQRFAKATTAYVNPYIMRGEWELNRFERQLFAFLLSKTERAQQAAKDEWEKRLRLFRDESGQLTDPGSREFQAELGRWLQQFEHRNQMQGFNVLARRQYSKPNMKLTVNERFANRMAARPVAEVDYVDQVIVGSRAQGFSYTRGSVSLDFVENPYSAQLTVHLNASVSSDTYSKEGNVTAYTSAAGNLGATRDLSANVGSVTVFPARSWGNVSSQFLGTNCLPLVDRIAFRRYSERRQRANEVASERARQQLLDRFSGETDEAFGEGLGRVTELRDRREELLERLFNFRDEFSEILAQKEDGSMVEPYPLVDPFVLPRISVNSTPDAIHVWGTLEGDNRLAAGSEPPPGAVPVDVRFQVHESMTANFIAPLIQGRLLENWQFTHIAEALTSQEVEAISPDEEKRFSILFMEGRPIQFEYENNEIGVTVYGKEFRREGQRYRDPIKISARFQVVNHEGVLKLVLVGSPNADFAIPALPGERSAEAIAFRQFLQDNLTEVTQGDRLEQAVELPANLLPLEFLEDQELAQQLAGAQLVEFTAEHGWITLGWNYSDPDTPMPNQIAHTPAIWPPPAPSEIESDDDTQPDLPQREQPQTESDTARSHLPSGDKRSMALPAAGATDWLQGTRRLYRIPAVYPSRAPHEGAAKRDVTLTLSPGMCPLPQSPQINTLSRSVALPPRHVNNLATWLRGNWNSVINVMLEGRQFAASNLAVNKLSRSFALPVRYVCWMTRPLSTGAIANGSDRRQTNQLSQSYVLPVRWVSTIAGQTSYVAQR